MRRDLAKLGASSYDVAVIGGGIHGAFAAWDAALRGLSVALIEQVDFGHATSANSQRIVHGGLRYLQGLDLRRMRESIRERRSLLRHAPHLVRPLACLMPTYARRRRGRVMMAAAFAVNDFLSWDRNSGLRAVPQRIPRGRLVSKAECLELAPGLPEPGLTGGALWYDGQIQDSERLTLAVVRAAADAGADAANHLRVTGPTVVGSQLSGVMAEDQLTGQAFPIRARMILNAAGPWASRVLSSLRTGNGRRDRSSSVAAHRLKGICLVTRRLPNAAALAVECPDARSAVEGLLFLTPWRDDLSLVGCAYPMHGGDPAACETTAEEVERLLDDVNRAYPAAELEPEDVRWVCSGLLPTRPALEGARPALESRHRIIDHQAVDGVAGLVSMVGVKYSTARHVAAEAIDRVMTRLGRVEPSRTADAPVHGGAIEDFDRFAEELVRARPAGLSAPTLRRLARSHGTDCREMLASLAGDPTAGAPIPGAPEVIGAEVIHAARNEMAMTLGDVVFRRTALALSGHPEDAAIAATAAILAAEHGWNRERIARERSEVETSLRARAGAIAAGQSAAGGPK